MAVRRTHVRLPEWNGTDPIRNNRRTPEAHDDLVASHLNGTKADSPTNQALELIRQRSAPALLIVAHDNRLMYSNDQTLQIFKDPQHVPMEIQQLCNRIRGGTGEA